MSASQFVPPAAGRVLAVLDDRVTVKMAPEDTDHAWELFELAGPAASGPPLHAHPWRESYYVLEGVLDVQIAGRRETLTAGAVAIVPPGVAHTFKIRSERARFLVLTSGDRAGAFFAELDRERGDGTSMDAVVAVALRNGLALEGPPLA